MKINNDIVKIIKSKTLTISTRPENDESNNICISYKQLESILAGEIETIIVLRSNGTFKCEINNLQEKVHHLESRGEYFLLKSSI